MRQFLGDDLGGFQGRALMTKTRGPVVKSDYKWGQCLGVSRSDSHGTHWRQKNVTELTFQLLTYTMRNTSSGQVNALGKHQKYNRLVMIICLRFSIC